MHLIGRYAHVRWLSAAGAGPPWELDRKWQRMRPASEWSKSRAGVRIRRERGTLSLFGSRQPFLPFIIGVDQGASPSIVADNLSSAYSAGVSGAAVAARLLLPSGLTLQDTYFDVTGLNGAGASNMVAELRTGTAAGPDTTAPGLVQTKTVGAVGTTGWKKVTGWTATPTGGAYYWLIVGDTAGGFANFAAVGKQFNSVTSSATPHLHLLGSDTFNGFSNTSLGTGPACMVLVFTNGRVQGLPFDNVGFPAFNALQKGIVLTTLSLGGSLYAASLGPTGDANLSGMNVFSGSNGPGGTGDIGSTTTVLSNSAGSKVGVWFGTLPTLVHSVQYRCVFTFSGASLQPQKLNIGTGVDANLQACMQGGGAWYYAMEQAGTPNTWGADDANAFPDMALLVDSYVTTGDGTLGSAPYPMRG